MTPKGSGSWIQRIVIDGKRRDIRLGSARFVTLDEARQHAFENRKAARLGQGVVANGTGKVAPTFEAMARTVIDERLQAGVWKSEAGAVQWRQGLGKWVFPMIGNIPVDRIGRAKFLAVLKQRAKSSNLWTDHPKVAADNLARIRIILDSAVGNGHLKVNPCDKAVLAAMPKAKANGEVKHHAALHYSNLADALASIDASDAFEGDRLCTRWIALTACRSGEAREAQGDEIDLKAKTWTIPASRTKTAI